MKLILIFFMYCAIFTWAKKLWKSNTLLLSYNSGSGSSTNVEGKFFDEKAARSLEEINGEIFRIVSFNSEVATLVDLTRDYVVGEETFEKRSIYGIKISSRMMSKDDHKPNILILSGHNPSEIFPPEVCLKYANLLAESWKDKSSEIYSLLEKYVFYVVPVLNVDGYDFVFHTDSHWRKNRSPTGESTIGVDLNRNYDVGWDFADDEIYEYRNFTCLLPSERAGLKESSSPNFRGNFSFSEIETRVMKNMMETLRFAKTVDLQGDGRFVYFGMRDCFELDDNRKRYIDYAIDEIASAGNFSKVFPWNFDFAFVGDMTMYHYLKYSDFSISVKTGRQDGDEDYKIEDVMNLLIKFVKIPIPYIGRLLDRDSNPLADIYIFVNGSDDLNGEIRRTSEDGYFYLFLKEGNYEIRFCKTLDHLNCRPVSEAIYIGKNFEVSKKISTIFWSRRTYLVQFFGNFRRGFVTVVSLLSLFVVLCLGSLVCLRCVCRCFSIEEPLETDIALKDGEIIIPSSDNSSYISQHSSTTSSSWSAPVSMEYVTDNYVLE